MLSLLLQPCSESVSFCPRHLPPTQSPASWLSVVPRKLPKRAQHPKHLPASPHPLTPPALCPISGCHCLSEFPSLTLRSRVPPAPQRQAPGQRDPAHHQDTTTAIDAKLSSEVDGHLSREGGRAGLSPALPPALGSWDLALPAWHSGSPSAGSTPPQLVAFPATQPHSLPPRLLSPPLAPPPPPPTRAPAQGPLGLGGVN